MLEFVRERAQGWFAKVILGLIMVPFALWGVDSYMRQGGDSATVAKVGGQKITRQDFDRALKDQQEQMRITMGSNFDPALLDRPEMRKSVLDSMIDQRVLNTAATRAGISISDEYLAQFIANIEEFQENGKFSQARYEAVLRQQNMTPAIAETRIRQNLITAQLVEGLVNSSMLSRNAMEGLILLGEQQREISQAFIYPEAFLANIQPTPAELKAYYDKHREDFRVPEQARLEYVVLSVDDLAQQMSVSDDEVRKAYAERAAQAPEPEQRQASHILILAPEKASAAEKQAASAKAEQILKEVKKTPAAFAELAKRYSQDPGSAAKGGDLGMFPRGVMDKPFEAAVFGMMPGDIAGPIQSSFGFHVIRLTAVKGGKARTFEEMKVEIAQELKKQKAGKRFAEIAETFSSNVYEQPGSLKSVADALKLKIQTSSWVSKKGGEVALLNNAKLLQAVFSEEVLKLKRNTDAIEVRPNTLVSARVAEFKPASYKPFEEIAVELAGNIRREQSIAAAVKSGKEQLAKLQAGQEVAGLQWGAPILINRQNASTLGNAALTQIFRANARKLPAHVGLENPKGGYMLIKVTKVVESSTLDERKLKGYTERLHQLLTQENYAALVGGMKQRADITIKKEALEKTDR